MELDEPHLLSAALVVGCAQLERPAKKIMAQYDLEDFSARSENRHGLVKVCYASSRLRAFIGPDRVHAHRSGLGTAGLR